MKLTIEGSTKTVRIKNGKRLRGFDTKLLGRASCNLKQRKFVQFDLVAVGTRWGSRAGRQDGPALAPIGVALRLAPTGKRLLRTPPAQIRRGGYFD